MWGKVAQGLVRTHCVIGKLPKAELLVQGSDLQGKVIDLIELLGMGTLRPFHGALRPFSIIVSQYGIPEEASGTIGVIGPTRMQYMSVIGGVQFLSSFMSDLIMGVHGRS